MILVDFERKDLIDWLKLLIEDTHLNMYFKIQKQTHRKGQ